MNRKNNANMTNINFHMDKALALYPMPTQRMGDENIYQTIEYSETGNKSVHWESVRQTFQSYGKQIAINAGVKDKGKVCMKSKYGYQLANGDVFIKVILQTYKPTEGFIDLFAIQALWGNPSIGLFIYLGKGITLPCVSSISCVMEKIYDAQNYYDPNYLRHSKDGLPFRVSDVPVALSENIVIGNENPLTLQTEEAVCTAYNLCNHIKAMPPSQMLSGIEGICRRLEPQMDQIQKAKEIRAQGIAVGNGVLLANPQKTLIQENMVPLSLLEAERKEKERIQRQNQYLRQALSIESPDI